MTPKRKADQYSAKCEATREDGTQCRAWAVRGSDPPRCQIHGLSKDEQIEQARKGGRHRAAQRRALAEPKPRTGISPTISLAEVLHVVAPALKATFEHDSSPDWGARLEAAGTILMCFPRYMRATPEDVRSVLERSLPQSVLEQREMRKRMTGENVYKALRAEHDKLRIRHHPITGLYVEEYPGFMVAPWEERKEVLRSRPKPEGRLERMSDGTLVLYRDDEPPLVGIEEDNLQELTRGERATLRAYLLQEQVEHADA